MRTVTRLSALIVTAGLLSAASTGTAAAVDGRPGTTTHQLAAACHFNPNFEVTPGLVLQTTTTGGVASEGAAPLDCLGTLDGAAITGGGTIRTTGSYTGTCTSGSGSLTEYITLPTAKGAVSLISALTFSYLGAGGTFTGTYLSGVFYFLPLEGDCVTTPMTRTVARHIAHGNSAPTPTDAQGPAA
jgi:hypothetical protein